LLARGEATNELYVTEDGAYVNFADFMDNGKSHHADLLVAARKTHESLPANDFPEGNWGGVEHGLQLSLRFTKSNYTNGESIAATLLLRNTTTSSMNGFIYPRYTEFCDGPANFNIASASGDVPPSHAPLITGVAPRPRQIPESKTQHKLLEHVESGYNLTNGAYTIQAVIRVIYPGTNHSEHFEIKSAKVPIEIK